MLDDQRWDTLDSTHAVAHQAAMPVVMDGLAAHGVTFSNAYATTALCAPSRASFLTGQYASTHGLRGNGNQLFWTHQKGILEPQMLPVWLEAAGYRTALVGKYSNGYRDPDETSPSDGWPYVPPGWTDWYAFSGQGQYRNFKLCERPENGTLNECPINTTEYSTYTLRDKAVSFIQQAGAVGQTRPFFLLFAPKAPHGRGGGDSEAEPECADVSFHDLPNWRPPSHNETDVSDKPTWLEDNVPLLGLDARRAIDRIRQQAMDTLKSVGGPPALETGCLPVDLDRTRAVKAILEALDEPRLYDNTVVIFTGDNGYLWGEHRLHGKTAPYEESVRVPLVIRPAGGTTPRTETSLALNIDLTATIVDLAVASPTRALQGRSLRPFLQGETPAAPWRTRFLLEAWADAPLPTYAGVRSTTSKYVEYQTGAPTPEREYYLASDRYELDNVESTHPDVEEAARCLREFRPHFPDEAPADFVFASDFECGDLTGWSPAPAQPNLTVAPEAALGGTHRGLKVVVNSGDQAWNVQDDTPNNEPRYRARFYFDRQDFDPGPSTATDPREVTLLIAGEENPTRRLVAILLRKTVSDEYFLVARIRQDGANNVVDLGPFPIAAGPHRVEFDWKKAVAQQPPDGSFQLWIDGVTPPGGSRGDLDTHDHTVDFARLGAISLQAGASGTLYFDGFVSHRVTAIGP